MVFLHIVQCAVPYKGDFLTLKDMGSSADILHSPQQLLDSGVIDT